MTATIENTIPRTTEIDESPVIKGLNWRYATKKFSTKELPEEKLNILLESLRLSASAFGLQAWRFVLIQNRELREKLVEASYGQRQVADASHLIVLSRPSTLTDEDVDRFLESSAKIRGTEPNAAYGGYMKSALAGMTEDQKAIWMEKQVYIALGSLLAAAGMEEVDSTPMEGFNREAYDEILDLKTHGLKSVVIAPVGYRAEDDGNAEALKVRYPTEDVILKLG